MWIRPAAYNLAINVGQISFIKTPISGSKKDLREALMADCMTVASPSCLSNEGGALRSRSCQEVMLSNHSRDNEHNGEYTEGRGKVSMQQRSLQRNEREGKSSPSSSSLWASSGRARPGQARGRQAQGELEANSGELAYSSSTSCSSLWWARGASSPRCSPKVVLVCFLNVSPLNSRG